MQTIDMTPNWVDILDFILDLYEHGDANARSLARKELGKMAAGCDAYIAARKELRNGQR